jgi:hypothetical protein
VWLREEEVHMSYSQIFLDACNTNILMLLVKQKWKKANAQLHPMQKEMSKFGYPFWTTLKIPVWF